MLDRVLTEYGPETQETRDLLRRAVASAIERIWTEEKLGPMVTKGLGERVDIEDVQTLVAKGRAERVNIEAVVDKLRQLFPRTDAQRWLKSRALEVSGEIGKVRWLLITQTGKRSIPLPFLAILIFWPTIIFASFGLFSPRNPTIIVVLLVCAFSATGAVFLILDLDTPYSGLLKVSSAPLRNTLKFHGGMATRNP